MCQYLTEHLIIVKGRYDRAVSAGRALPTIVRGKSSVHGYGVFAAEAITKNTRIIDYAGELIRNGPVCEAREETHQRRGELWVFRVNRAWSRDASVGGNIARFINHSCTPNCYFEVIDKTIWIKAARNIRRGEELTYDYKPIGERTIKCRCRADCPNWI
jgi:histone-lysine N-methyltransferase SETD1